MGNPATELKCHRANDHFSVHYGIITKSFGSPISFQRYYGQRSALTLPVHGNPFRCKAFTNPVTTAVSLKPIVTFVGCAKSLIYDEISSEEIVEH